MRKYLIFLMLILMSSFAFAVDPLTISNVGYYAMDDVGNYSQNVYNSEGVNNGFYQDGSSSYVLAPDSSDFTIGTNNFTIGGDYNLSADLTFHFMTQGTGDNTNRWYFLNSHAANTISFNLYTSTVNRLNLIWNYDAFTKANVFQNIIMSRVSNVCELWVDSVSLGTKACNYDFPDLPGALSLGAETDDDNDMVGRLRQNFFYNGYGFTDADVKTVYNGSNKLPIADFPQQDYIVFINDYTSLNDSSSSDNFGTGMGGITLVNSSNCKLGQCYDLDGTNDYIITDQIITVAPFTLCGWVSTEVDLVSGSDYDAIIHLGNTGFHYALDNTGYMWTWHDPGKAQVIKYIPNMNGRGLQHACLVSTSNVFGTANQLIYWNGTLQTGTVLGGAGSADYAGNTYIGFNDDNTDYFNGIIDEAAIWNRALNASEILELYNSGDGYNPYAAVAPTPPVTTPPIISLINVTSENIFGENSTIWSVADTFQNFSSDVITGTYTTDINANCSQRIGFNQNYSTMVAANINYKSATTDTTSHSFTLYDNLTFGDQALYIACISSTGYENATSQTGDLNITYWDTPSVTLNLPADLSTDNDGSIIYGYTPESNFSFVNCSLWTNSTGSWHLNQTNTSISNGSINYFNETLSNGFYIWNVNCWNDKNSDFASSNYSFTVDIKILNSSLCVNMSKIFLFPNLTYFNFSTNTVTQYNVTPVNESGCGWSYNLTAEGNGNITAKINVSLSSDYVLRYNDLVMTNVSQVLVENAVSGTSYYVNISGDYVNASSNVVWEDSLSLV